MLDPFKIIDLNRNLDTAQSFSSWLFANHEELRNLGLLAAAIIGLILLFWRSFNVNRSSKAAERQAEIALKQAETSSKSHMADTYSRAIEQLGALNQDGKPSLGRCLGGLYALEQIAQVDEDYHPQIMEVLCAYVRLQCPIQLKVEGKEKSEKQNVKPFRIDVQSYLTVIGRRNVLFDSGKLDLCGIDIQGANLGDANLEGAILEGANLYLANLEGANLEGANLYLANLCLTNLRFAKLEGLNLCKANLEGAELSMTNLRSANLIMANLRSANLEGANLEGADLIGANLIGANLIGANLSDANLKVADLTGANLTRVNLTEANLTRVNLRYADLSGTDLSGARYLTCEQIQSAKIDRKTELPDYIEITWVDDETYTCKIVDKDDDTDKQK